MASEKQHLRHCILFAFESKKNAAEATKMICSALGKGAVTHKTCKKWYQRFRNRDFDLSDRKRSGQPKKFKDEELEQLLNENSNQSQQKLALQLRVTRQCISLRLHQLEEIPKEDKLIPHSLSPENTERRLDMAISLLSRFKRKDFLYKIVTGGEKWVFYDLRRNKSWIDPGQASTSMVKPNIHAKKILLCIWWDVKGVIYHELLNLDQTINTDYYQQQLLHLSKALEQKRPYTCDETRHVILQHSALSDTTKATKDLIYTLGWEILPHAAYSSDLAPSDYQLFPSLQNHLEDRHFKTIDLMQNTIDDFIASKPPSFFHEGIHQLPDRWSKVIENNGDHFEH